MPITIGKNDLYCVKSEFDSAPYWTKPVPENLLVGDFMCSSECVKLFDQNGYDICKSKYETRT